MRYFRPGVGEPFFTLPGMGFFFTTSMFYFHLIGLRDVLFLCWVAYFICYFCATYGCITLLQLLYLHTYYYYHYYYYVSDVAV
jgi:hypothetical protein